MQEADVLLGHLERAVAGTLVMVKEALRSQVPVIMIDVKGDLPNLVALRVVA